MKQKKITVFVITLCALFFTNDLVAQKKVDFNKLPKAITSNSIVKKDTSAFFRDLFYDRNKDGISTNRNLFYVPQQDGVPKMILLSHPVNQSIFKPLDEPIIDITK